MPLVIILYLLVNVSYFTVMSVTEVLEAPAVALVGTAIIITEDVIWI